MARPKQGENPVTPDDLITYLDSYSDFAFELRCLELLTCNGFDCEHGGTYADPVTNKARQFDIRAVQSPKPFFRLRLAVECKNLSESSPLLVLRVPRSIRESFHQCIFSHEPIGRGDRFDVPAFRQSFSVIQLEAPLSNYLYDEPVGKSCVQLRKSNDGLISGNDAEVFEKWSQALSSLHDVADYATKEGTEKEKRITTVALPILVVPDNTLWSVDYGHDGARLTEARPARRCSLFVGRDYFIGPGMQKKGFVASHLEFVTLTGLQELLESARSDVGKWLPEYSK